MAIATQRRSSPRPFPFGGAGTEIEAFGDPGDRDVIAHWKRRFSEAILPVDVELLREGRFSARVGVLSQANVVMAHYDITPLRMIRGADLADRNDEDLTVSLVLDGVFIGEQDGRRHALRPGEAVCLTTSRPSTLETPTGGSFVGLRLSTSALVARGLDPDRLGSTLVGRGSAGLRLLRAYMEQLRKETVALPLEVRPMVARHVADLVAAALRPLDEDEGGGVRMARKARLRQILAARHADPDLTLDDVARAVGLSPRTVQIHFCEDGTSFSDALREIRLACAANLLETGEEGADRISDVAFATGFRDVSTFNRAFRRRFGTTPRDHRRRAR